MRRDSVASVLIAGLALSSVGAGEAGRMRVIRSWPDEVVVDGRAARGRIEIVFDYGAGRASEIRYDGAGHEVTRKALPLGFQPAPAPEEIAEAMDAVRGDRELAKVLQRVRGGLDGGFLLEQKQGPCGPGSRCLLIQMATADRMGIIRWMVYNLVSQTFAYRDYTPAAVMGRP